MEEIGRIMYDAFDKYFDDLEKTLYRMSEITDSLLRATDQRLAGHEHDARQPRLATEVDVRPGTKTRKCAEDAAADQARHADSCSTKKIDDSTSSTSFGMTAKPPALPRRKDVLGDKGAEAPKLCLSPMEIRALTAAGGVLPAGTASTATRTIFPRTFFVEPR